MEMLFLSKYSMCVCVCVLMWHDEWELSCHVDEL